MIIALLNSPVVRFLAVIIAWGIALLVCFAGIVGIIDGILRLFGVIKDPDWLHATPDRNYVPTPPSH